MLTTGFDAPQIDCVAILRPTLSPGLWYQMVGRSFRLHPGKQNALVLDFGGNAIRHGPVDQIRARDNNCGFEFPKPERASHDAQASTESVLSGQITETTYQVRDTFYSVHVKQGTDENAPRTMRVDYKVGFYQYKSEWVCFEHTGYARWKAEMWWRARSLDPVPTTAQQAVDIANAGGLATTRTIAVRSVAGEKFDRILDYQLDEKPEPVPIEVRTAAVIDDIPS